MAILKHRISSGQDGPRDESGQAALGHTPPSRAVIENLVLRALVALEREGRVQGVTK